MSNVWEKGRKERGRERKMGEEEKEAQEGKGKEDKKTYWSYKR